MKTIIPTYCRRWATAAGFLMVSTPALAGTIQGITAQPSSASTGDPIVVTVTGTGTCANGVVVNFGDGDSQEKAGDLPLVFNAKTYSQSGVFTVSASKKSGTLGCNAGASTAVNISTPGGKLAKLCAVIDCKNLLNKKDKFALSEAAKNQALKVLPHIEKVFTTPELWTLTPSGDLYVKGGGFGAQPGKVYLRLYSPYQNDLSMAVENWNNNDIKVKVPGNISGALDHNAAVFVETNDGFKSGLQTINFKATRVSKWLKMGDPGVHISCSHGANHNLCNNHHHSDGNCFTSGQTHTNSATFTVKHVNCDSVVDWDDGTDTVKVTLKNGWEIAEIDMTYQTSSSSETLNMPSFAELDAAVGSTSWTKNIYFDISPGPDSVNYVFWVRGRGPKGVTHY